MIHHKALGCRRNELDQAAVCIAVDFQRKTLIIDAYLPRVANVAGTQEPIHGPTAIQSIAKQAETTPYTELRKEDLKWAAMESTCAETQTFYLLADSGHLGMAQVIYSNVA